jgi:hypothetical protein
MMAWQDRRGGRVSQSVDLTRRERNTAKPLVLVVAAAGLSVALALIVNWQHFAGRAADECFVLAPAADAP